MSMFGLQCVLGFLLPLHISIHLHCELRTKGFPNRCWISSSAWHSLIHNKVLIESSLIWNMNSFRPFHYVRCYLLFIVSDILIDQWNNISFIINNSSLGVLTMPLITFQRISLRRVDTTGNGSNDCQTENWDSKKTTSLDRVSFLAIVSRTLYPLVSSQ